VSSYREATVADLASIMAIEAACFPPKERWSAESWASCFAVGDKVRVAETDGSVVAALTFRVIFDEIELASIAVLPQSRGKGVARAMLTDLLEYAATEGASRVLLEVAEENEIALGLYRSFGFAEMSKRANYYGTGKDALVMEKVLERRKDE
jgi:ribosomal-protein-alanine acetyltransferase